jgi:hypothetical protein
MQQSCNKDAAELQQLCVCILSSAGLARTKMYSYAGQMLALQSLSLSLSLTHSLQRVTLVMQARLARTFTNTQDTRARAVGALLHLCCSSVVSVACLQCALGGSVVYEALT